MDRANDFISAYTYVVSEMMMATGQEVSGDADISIIVDPNEFSLPEEQLRGPIKKVFVTAEGHTTSRPSNPFIARGSK